MSLPKIQRLIKGGYSVTQEDIQKEYLKWVSINEYLIFEHKEHGGKRRYIASLCPKRGNPKYAFNVKRKFQELSLPYEYEKEQLFKNNSQNCSEEYTNVLFITLTFDTKLTDYKTAWQTIGENWNSFLSAIKKRYGKIYVIRCFESFENNYPHIHALLYMPNQKFMTWQEFNKKGELVWVVGYENTQYMSKHYHSFINVQGMPYLADGLKYLGKYITKASDLSQKAVKTLSLTWGFRKRAFSIGHKFKQEIFKRYVADNLTHLILIQTKPSQQNLNQEQVINHRSEFLKIPSNKPLEIGDSNRTSLHNILGFEKYKMVGILGKDTLKKMGGIPKGEWSFGLNEMQNEYVDCEFYKIKPVLPLDASEERRKQIKNPFAEPNGAWGSEQWRQVHEGMNAKKPQSPISDEDNEWWIQEGQFLSM
jgi:hypothetical protein